MSPRQRYWGSRLTPAERLSMFQHLATQLVGRRILAVLRVPESLALQTFGRDGQEPSLLIMLDDAQMYLVGNAPDPTAPGWLLPVQMAPHTRLEGYVMRQDKEADNA